MRSFSTFVFLTIVMIGGWLTQSQVAFAQNPTDIVGTDLKISGDGANVPEIALNDYYVTAVYEQGGNIYIKSATSSSGWVPRTEIGSGSYAKVVFKPPQPNSVYVVWLRTNDGTIQARSCTFSANAAPVCDAAQPVALAQQPAQVLDVTLDGFGNLFATWPLTNTVAVAQLPNGADSWVQRPALATDNTNAATPRTLSLVASDAYLHLAFENSNGQQISYYRSNDQAENWINRADFNLSDFTANEHQTMNHPELAVSGSQIHLVWNALHLPYFDVNEGTTVSVGYGLVGTASSNDGATWNTSTYLVTGNTIDGVAVTDDIRFAQRPADLPDPFQEARLRPSVAMTGSQLAVVWQQRPQLNCGFVSGTNGTSEIYFAASGGYGLFQSSDDSDFDYYNIDPDIAVGNDGRTHIVYLRARPTSTAACGDGGGTDEYAVYYRGDFLRTANSDGGSTNEPSLSITKAGPEIVTANDLMTYTLTIINSGPANATNLVVTDVIPENTIYERGGNSVNDTTVTWNVDQLSANGGTVNLTFVVRTIIAGTVLNNNYSVAAQGGYSASGTTPVTTTVEPLITDVPTLNIVKSAPAIAEIGQPFTYTITVINSGTADATNVVLSDELPTNVQLLNQGGGTLTDNRLSWSIGTLSADGGLVSRSFIVAASQTVTNSAYQVTSSETGAVSGQTPIVTTISTDGGCLPTDGGCSEPDDTSVAYLPVVIK